MPRRGKGLLHLEGEPERPGSSGGLLHGRVAVCEGHDDAPLQPVSGGSDTQGETHEGHTAMGASQPICFLIDFAALLYAKGFKLLALDRERTQNTATSC